MEPAEVQALYGGAYAEQYNSIWQESGRWDAEAAHHVRSLTELIEPDTRWLDVGCGTGWNLSQFPGVARGGLDLSPDMLRQAEAANPDALFLRQGDIRVDIPEWHGQWDLVTCTGQPWSYLASMDEIEVALTNLARWTAPDGVCFAPMGDLSDLTGLEMDLPRPGDEPPYDTPVINGVIWSLHESDRDHVNMIWPSVGFCIDVFARHFRRVEVVRWPHDPPWIPVARRVLVGREKREPGDDTPVTIVEHPIPPVEPGDGPTDQATSAATPESRTESSPVSPTEIPAPDHVASTAAVTTAPADLALSTTGRIPGRPVYDQPLSYLVSRLRPWSPGFWRSVGRRAGRLRP